MELSSHQGEELIKVLKARFEKNIKRHKSVEWNKVQAKPEFNTKKKFEFDDRLLLKELTGIIVKYDE